ncbi:hypothetical protein ABEB36_006165 [Hypothenemus hampei]|uniref:Uncharacterized protein n=1 Tax=Hypothenemus hampei TaxID=57062 RepID=A0ABD1EPL5_HYPHA
MKWSLALGYPNSRKKKEETSPGKENEFKSQQQLGHLGTPTPELSNESALGFGVGRKRGVRFEGSLEGVYQAPSGAPCPILTSVSALGVSSLFGRDHRCRPTPPPAEGEKPPNTDRPRPEENAVTHAPAVDGTMVSRPGECGARD